MTDFPPSDTLKQPHSPFESQATELGLDLKLDLERLAKGRGEGVETELHSASKSRVIPAQGRPILTTKGGEDLEPPARPEPADEEAWSRLGPQTLYARLFRPIFNLFLLSAILLPTIGLIAVVAIVNWVAFRDHKKIFFKQYRVGYRGNLFELWKFRTMMDSSRPHYESWVAGEEDARVTKLGKFLRRSHLDELPQLLNVLNGEMNLIGPRPEMVEVDEWVLSEVPLFYERLAVKPGITGFAQIHQGYVGNDIDGYRHKLVKDIAYIKDLTFYRDLRVLALTPVWMFCLRGWNNDRTRKAEKGSVPTGANGVIHHMPRAGVPSTHAAQILEQIDPTHPF